MTRNFLFTVLLLAGGGYLNFCNSAKVKEAKIHQGTLSQDNECFFKTQKSDDGDIQLVWGTSDFSRSFDLEYEFYFKKVYSDENRLILSFGCGSPCWAYMVLPLNKNDDAIPLHFPLGQTENYNIILTGSETRENEIIVYNLDEKKIGRVFIDSLSCQKAFYIDCFNIVSLNKDSLKIETDDELVFVWNLSEVLE